MVVCESKSKRKKALGTCAIVFAVFAIIIFILVALLEWTDVIRCNHTWAHRGYVAPTCVTQGFSDEQYCTKCGDIFKFPGRPTPCVSVEQCTACDSHEFRFKFDSEAGTCVITGLGPDFSGDKVVIPAEYKGFRVIGIGDGAFGRCEDIKSVEIADTVLEIGINAFAYCTALESVNFGATSTIKIINNQAFMYCESITRIDIPDSVIEIGEKSFAECMSLENVVFGEDSALEIINGQAFKRCRNLTSFTVPAGVVKIGSEVFWHCNSLQKVEFMKTDGWAIKSAISTQNTPIDVENPEENATNLLSIYIDEILIRVEG